MHTARHSLALILSFVVASGSVACGSSDDPNSNSSEDPFDVPGPRDIDGDGAPGGFQLGGAVDGDADPEPVEPTEPNNSKGNGNKKGNCEPGSIMLRAVVRDFQGDPGHPDFETYNGGQPTVGLVELELGPDRKPVYTGLCSTDEITDACPSGRQMTDEESFNQWYRDTPEVNKAYEVILSLDPVEHGLQFDSQQFFPLDGVGFGDQGRGHNYHFTTEIHTEFQYLGGEVFTFLGDDDVWIFINGKLALDLGGLHGDATGTVDLDKSAKELGLERGKTYPFDLFHAERHTLGSRFHISTNFKFTKCGTRILE